MERLLLASAVLGWVLAVGVGLCLVALLQVLGAIHLRGPLGHHALVTDEGPALHERVPAFRAEDAHGLPVGVRDYLGREVVVLFASPSCGPCRGLLEALAPTLRDLAQAPEALLVLEAVPRAGAPRHGGVTTVFDPDARVRAALGITRVPYALLVDRDGVVRMKGVANTRQQLEGLIAGRGHRLDGAVWQAPPAASRQPAATAAAASASATAWEDA